jgi:RNA-directed DNA polymerase
VCDPATLVLAFERVAGNSGAKIPGVDGLTVASMEDSVGVSGFLIDLRDCDIDSARQADSTRRLS